MAKRTSVVVKIKVKISLWAAIKLRIAGLQNLEEDDVEITKEESGQCS